MKKHLGLLLFGVLALMTLFGAPKVQAQGADAAAGAAEACTAGGGSWSNIDGRCITAAEIETNRQCQTQQTVLGMPTWYKYLRAEEISGKCRPIVDDAQDALPIGLAILEIMLTLGGLVAVIMVFVGGLKYVLAQGESEKAAGGRKTVVNAMIGLVILIIATRVVSFIGNSLG